MKAYHFSFEGSWLGGNALIAANSISEATALLRGKLIKEGYGDDKFELVSESEIEKPTVLYYDNGDY